MITTSSVACINPYTHDEIRLLTQIPPGSRKRHFRMLESSFIALHRVPYCRLLGNCLLLRSSRLTIGLGDAYRTALEGLQITSVGTELRGMENRCYAIPPLT
jgi:hypothetical protein